MFRCCQEAKICVDVLQLSTSLVCFIDMMFGLEPSLSHWHARVLKPNLCEFVGLVRFRILWFCRETHRFRGMLWCLIYVSRY